MKKILYYLIIFIFVVSICTYINFNSKKNKEYQGSLNNLEEIIKIKSSTITDKGIVMTTLDSLKITTFIKFCNTLDQKLSFMNLIYLLSVLLVALRLYTQEIFNKNNISVKLPKTSIFCLLLFTFWMFTFSSTISIIQIVLIYSFTLLTLKLIKLIRINSKSHIKTNSTRENLDLLTTALMALTMIGLKAIPMTYLIFGTIPYCVYVYLKIRNLKSNIVITS